MNAQWDDPKQPTRNQVHDYLPSGQRMTTVEENIAFQRACKEWGEAMLQHLFPGALVFMFGGTRMWHRLASGMEDAGFAMWDTIIWLHAQGFPKAQDIGRMIDQRHRNEREVLGRNPNSREASDTGNTLYKLGTVGKTDFISRGKSGWDGYKTPAMKPAWEPILCFRAPRDGLTYADLATTYGTGCLNVDGGRISVGDGAKLTTHSTSSGAAAGKGIYPPYGSVETHESPGQELGRYPSNIILDEGSAEILGEPSRFFYCAKVSKAERNAGCEDLPDCIKPGGMRTANGDAEKGHSSFDKGFQDTVQKNGHLTVKPLALTRYLATLLLPPTSVIPRRLLVPFCGSGSEMIGGEQGGWDQIVGVEQNPHFCEIAERRLKYWRMFLPGVRNDAA